MRFGAEVGWATITDPCLGPLSMEALMAQRTDHPLKVHESFETTRLGQQCLIEAYARLVPIRRKARRRAGQDEPRSEIIAASRRGGEHG